MGFLASMSARPSASATGVAMARAAKATIDASLERSMVFDKCLFERPVELWFGGRNGEEQ